MLFGREKELSMLSEMYNSRNFRLMVMYGRRRVGKTSILREFAHKKDIVYFHAQVKNDQLNLTDFSKVLQIHFDKEYKACFSDWDNAFAYISSKLGEKRITIIIEEFHLIAAEYPAIVSVLQRAIDRAWRMKNVFLIISDSDMGFVENQLMGYDSPLYGRISGQIAVMPLDYLDCSRFCPERSAEDKILSYGILGGVPSYTAQFDTSLPISDNLARYILKGGCFLKDEPQAMLRTEFRDPGVYNSILEAIAGGAHRMNDISIMIHEESQKCAKYLNTLRSVWIVDKITPVGDDAFVKKSSYVFADNFFNFWYRFIFKDKSSLEFTDPEEAAADILASEDFKAYMDEIFKIVCREYMVRKTMAGKLPFAPVSVGKWWSGVSRKKARGDIDIVAADKKKVSAIFGKCKYDSSPFELNELEDLIKASKGFGKVNEAYYYLFSKSGFSDELSGKVKRNKNIKLINIEEIFKI